MTVVLIPLKLIPISPCFETTEQKTALTRLFSGAFGTGLLQTAGCPDWSTFIVA